MRRMISFTPVAHGTINDTADKFELDNKLEKGFYLIVIREGSYNQSCSCFLKITKGIYYHRSTVFIPATSPDGQSTILYFNKQHPSYLNIPIPNLIPSGSTVEVYRIA